MQAVMRESASSPQINVSKITGSGGVAGALFAVISMVIFLIGIPLLRYMFPAAVVLGGAVALIAGSRQKDLAALVLIAAPGTRGSDLILEQQSHGLDVLKLPEAERAAKVELQKRIQTAVMTGVGLEGLPEDVRKIADTAWFKSLLLFDPAEVMKDVKQPMLIVQGELDTQVPPHHAQKLAEMARARKKAAPVEVVLLPGVNHLLVRATTGEVSEYPDLKEKTIVPEVAQKIAEFLAK